ncbi:SRPBCC family protein [Streptomyces noursei]|uniref:SRPBCC family protein n=1 Tax=Streptomyces noursei TaxID=1971 RepID=UPI001675D194|nr:SRPBCC family protein [Streptomyces noursei]MCZ1012841.1 SRPBCC family protein [Streptomyces noursei]GGX20412.1 polyketide cyclase [Streptomyces noursei]
MRIPRFPEPAAIGSVTIHATAAQVYEVVSDPTAMARFAEETYRARWLDGGTRAVVGARFQGWNRNGLRRWATRCRVTDAAPAQCFAYEVTATPLSVPISRWQYDIAPAEEGCVITETNWIRVPLWFVPVAILVTGVRNRMGANGAHIGTTLERLKAHLEAVPSPRP